jgi:DNA-binding MarR family transcriptional regulator
MRATVVTLPRESARPGPDGLAEGIARLRRALRRGARVADPGSTLAVAQLELLAALAEHPGSRPGWLARLLHMRPNTVTTIVNNLTARGMVRRVAAETDRRAVELTVTEAGRQAVLAWQATNAAVVHLAASTLPARQRRALAAAVPALDALARAVDRLADTGGSERDRHPLGGHLDGDGRGGESAPHGVELEIGP